MITVEQRLAVEMLYADYAAALDGADFNGWPELFVEDCLYVVQPRENYDAGLPLATIRLESRGMLKDRVYGVAETLYHDPYYQRHMVNCIRTRAGEAGAIEAEANYLVIRTKRSQPSDILSAGRYLDELVEEDGRLKFRVKRCIFDSELIPNSLIYPI